MASPYFLITICEIFVLSKVEILSSERHADLKVKTGFVSDFGDVGPIVPVVASELAKLVLDFPVFLTKNPNTGQFELVAVTGFSKDENLFVDGDKLRAAYVPMDMRRQPFQACIIGEEESIDSLSSDKEVKIGINVESGRVNAEEGETLFNDDGSNTEYLESVSSVLGALMTGAQSTNSFLKAMADHELIEPVKLNVQLAGEQKVSFEGLYTIHAEKLAALSDADVLEFHKRGYLQACHAIIHSIGHVEKLIDWRAQRLAQE